MPNERQRFINNMAEHLNDDIIPKVGIFWYDIADKNLFSIIKYNYNEDLRPSHRYNHQKFKNNKIGSYTGDYKDKPRGRIFYDIETDEFIICVGSWINEYPDAKKLILKEFNLRNEFYKFKIDIHWEIGYGWENE